MGKARYTKNEMYFHEPTIKSAYMAGLIAADGNIYLKSNQAVVSVELTETDSGILEYIRSELEYTGKIGIRAARQYISGTIERHNKTSRRLQIHSATQYVEDLRKYYNITAAKSLTLPAPNISDPDLALSYILGYYYGDGSLSRSGAHRVWSVTFDVSYEFGLWLRQQLTARFGSTWGLYRGTGQGWKLVAGKKQTVQNFLDAMRVLPIPEEWKPLRKLYEDKYEEYRLAKEEAKKLRNAKLQNT